MKKLTIFIILAVFAFGCSGVAEKVAQPEKDCLFKNFWCSEAE